MEEFAFLQSGLLFRECSLELLDLLVQYFLASLSLAHLAGKCLVFCFCRFEVVHDVFNNLVLFSQLFFKNLHFLLALGFDLIDFNSDDISEEFLALDALDQVLLDLASTLDHLVFDNFFNRFVQLLFDGRSPCLDKSVLLGTLQPNFYESFSFDKINEVVVFALLQGQRLVRVFAVGELSHVEAHLSDVGPALAFVELHAQLAYLLFAGHMGVLVEFQDCVNLEFFIEDGDI